MGPTSGRRISEGLATRCYFSAPGVQSGELGERALCLRLLVGGAVGDSPPVHGVGVGFAFVFPAPGFQRAFEFVMASAASSGRSPRDQNKAALHPSEFAKAPDAG